MSTAKPARSLGLFQRLCLALGVGAAVGAPVVSASPAVAERVTAAPETPECAWGIKISADTWNAFFPDTAAAYWVLPYKVQEGLRIKLTGRFPDSRYASFNVYQENTGTFERNGVKSYLTDHRIEADEGSVNPWQRQAEPGGQYTLTLREDVSPGQVNTLPLAREGTPEGTGNYVVLRVYMPAGGDFDRVPLPEVTFERDGVSVPVPRCEPGEGTSEFVRKQVAAAGVLQPGQTENFYRPGEGDGDALFPNADSAYLIANVTPPAQISDKVYVIRGKAPRHTPGSHPSPWPAPDADVRYWSMCTNLWLPQRPVVVNRVGDEVDYGCRADDQTRLNADGEYTYVVGTEAQRARIEKVPGVTFLPFSLDKPNYPHAIMLRNMVVDPGFKEAVQNVPENGNWESAAEVMGPYYPRITTCTLKSLIANGPGNCG